MPRGHMIKTEGSIDRNIYYIKEGSVKVYCTDMGEEQIIRFGYRGNLIVALDSFFTNQPSHWMIETIKKHK